jgi:hypothetical protein
MKRTFWMLLASLFLTTASFAQEQEYFTEEQLAILDDMEDTISLLAYAVINDSLPEHRFGTCRELIPTLVRALKTKNSFHYPFNQLKSISIQYPQDSSFRVFTWQLYVDVNDYRYFGAIQMNTPDLKLYPLVDRSFEVNDVPNEILTADKWYGSVYYNLKEVESDAGKYYLLFGFDGYEFFRKRKVVDVLTFDEAGKPVFGAPVFRNQEDPKQPPQKNRLFLEYSAEASVRLNYDEYLEKIMFDHLIEMSGSYGEGPTKFPDGSYEGYVLEKDGFWYYQSKIFNQVSDEAPRPHPILDERTKDIFGKEKKNEEQP